MADIQQMFNKMKTLIGGITIIIILICKVCSKIYRRKILTMAAMTCTEDKLPEGRDFLFLWITAASHCLE